MPRQVRIEFEGAIYHILARGNQRQSVFLDRRDRETFIRTLGEACERTGFKVLAWVLMGNHYHLVIRTPNANLVEGMRWLQNTYTRRFNVRHGQWGRLFGDRYKSILVEEEKPSISPDNEGYLSSLIDYIHLNPARARIIQAEKNESILDYEWSSIARGIAQPPSRRATWMDITGILAMAGCQDSLRDRMRYIDRLNDRIRSEDAEKCGFPRIGGPSLHSTLRRGWYWGSQAFCDRLHHLIERSHGTQSSRDYSVSQQGHDHAIHTAEAIMARWREHFALGDLDPATDLKRGDRRRVALGWAIWKQTSLLQSWIAERTGLSSAANVSQQVRRYDRLPISKLTKAERQWKQLCQ